MGERDPAPSGCLTSNASGAVTLNLSALEHQLGALRHELRRVRSDAQRDRGLIDALLEQTTHGVVTCDREGLLTLNRAAERIWGGAPSVARIGEWARYRAFHADGRAFAAEDWSMARALRTGVAVEPEYVSIERFDGSRATILAGAAPIRNPAGQIEGAIGVFADVTALKEREEALLRLERRAAERAARLQEVTASLAQVLTPEQAASAIVEQGRAATGAFDGSLWVVDETARLVRLVHHATCSSDAIENWRTIPLDEPGPIPVLETIRRGEPVWIASRAAFHARYPNFCETEEYRSLPQFSIASLPMPVEGRCIGALVFSFAEERPLDDADASFLLVLARHAAQALERARLFDAERHARAAAEAAQARSSFLSEASALLASSLDYEATLSSVAALAVPRIGDWCAIDLADDFIRGIPAAIVAHADPAQVEVARELQRRFPQDRNACHGVPEVLRTGRPEIYPEITDAMIVSAGRSQEELEVTRALGLCSAMIVPMTARGRVVGTISLFSTQPNRRYGSADLEMAMHLARRAGLAVDNSSLYREAREAVRARDEVLAFVSHDLKNPLGAILMSAGLLQRTSSDPKVAQHAEVIRRSGARMDRLIRDLLDLARIDAGKFEVDRQRQDAGALLCDTAAVLLPLAHQKGVALEAEVDPRTPRVLADRDAILRVLSNLVGNAIAFTPASGRITLRCRPAGDAGVTFEVADTGVGIPDEMRPLVFDRFTKSRESYGGSGLGLTICRAIVEAHGGRIGFESCRGAGTTFWFTLQADLDDERTGAVAP